MTVLITLLAGIIETVIALVGQQLGAWGRAGLARESCYQISAQNLLPGPKISGRARERKLYSASMAELMDGA
jgi:hypothetical protein